MSIDTQILEAEAALHKLVTGTAEVEISYEDGKVRYAQADQAKLEAYIDKLNAKKAGTATRGAIGFNF